jgi:very-short-patch-repair endonuclease
VTSQQRSELEAELAFQMKVAEFPPHKREYRFGGRDGQRRWRFDFAFPEQKLAVEVDGGIYSGGRHTRGAGVERDCEKYNEALLCGWRVLRLTKQMVTSCDGLLYIEAALEQSRPAPRIRVTDEAADLIVYEGPAPIDGRRYLRDGVEYRIEEF